MLLLNWHTLLHLGWLHASADAWAKSALEDLFSGRWPAVIGFCWWNEAWENDDNKKHDTDMNISHDPQPNEYLSDRTSAICRSDPGDGDTFRQVTRSF